MPKVDLFRLYRCRVCGVTFRVLQKADFEWSAASLAGASTNVPPERCLRHTEDAITGQPADTFYLADFLGWDGLPVTDAD